VRYFLAYGMMPYSISKLANLQFQVSAWVYSQPLGNASGRALTWAFLGYAPWFQFLLGAFETIPALLLCFRRTWRIGALLLFPVLLNVVFLNLAMDLWDNTKRIGLILLFLNSYLLASDWPMYVSFLRTLLQRPTSVGHQRWKVASGMAEILIPAAGVAVFCYSFFTSVAERQGTISDFIGDRQINRSGSWTIRQMTVSGQDLSATSDRFMYFDFLGRCFYVSGSQTLAGQFKADRSHHTFEISGIELDHNPSTIKGTYLVRGDQLLLNGQRDSQPVDILLRRTNWGRQFPFE